MSRAILPFPFGIARSEINGPDLMPKVLTLTGLQPFDYINTTNRSSIISSKTLTLALILHHVHPYRLGSILPQF